MQSAEQGGRGGGGVYVKSLVLIGGGHSHVHLLKMLPSHPCVASVKCTIISREIDVSYRCVS